MSSKEELAGFPLDEEELRRQNEWRASFWGAPVDLDNLFEYQIENLTVHFRDGLESLGEVGERVVEIVGEREEEWCIEKVRRGYPGLIVLAVVDEVAEPIVAFYQEYDRDKQRWAVVMWAEVVGRSGSDALRKGRVFLVSREDMVKRVANAVAEFTVDPRRGEVVGEPREENFLKREHWVFERFGGDE